MKCEFLELCIFFKDKMDDMPQNAEVYKKMYCIGNNLNCARYMVAKRLGKENIPSTLLPNNLKEAISLLSGHA